MHQLKGMIDNTFLALIKRYHLHMCNRVLLLFEMLPQWNLHVNCNVNGTTFQSCLRFQTGLSSLRVSCKRALSSENKFLPKKIFIDLKLLTFFEKDFHLRCLIGSYVHFWEKNKYSKICQSLPLVFLLKVAIQFSK